MIVTCKLCRVRAVVTLRGKAACANHVMDVFTAAELKEFAAEGDEVHRAEREEAARRGGKGCC